MTHRDVNIRLPDLKDRSRKLPAAPGVYLMKSGAGRIIYIGKAKNLRKRVHSYFTGHKDIKTRHLLERTADIETFITHSEGEALLLENNLIKRFKPRYNINLKDGKSYPVIKLTNEEFPRVYRTRRIVFDGAKYYGPFARANQIDLYLHLIDRLFPLRKCRRSSKPKPPCFYYHIGRCSAPWHGKVSPREYRELVERVRLLLSGKTKLLIEELKEKMDQAAARLEYEQATNFRNQIAAIKQISEEQKVVDFQGEARDYVGFQAQESLAALAILQMRGGKMIGRDLFLLEDYSPREETLVNFLAQYYSGKDQSPGIIYLPSTVRELEQVREMLRKFTGKKINIKFPRRGRHAQILKMAAEAAGEQLQSSLSREGPALKKLQQALGLKHPPRRIEGFDVAHLSGQETVAAMVAYLQGKPLKDDYRRYRIRSLKGKIDDFRAIREVVARRYTRILNEKGPRPDLILIDGGKGQVNSAAAVLRVLGLSGLPVIGLAKREEEIFFPDQSEPLRLPEASAALKLLQSVRDEAHRFATTFHKSLRKRNFTHSLLEQIKGIGKQRSKKLLEGFGSIEAVKQQPPEALAAAAGISRKQAEDLLEQLTRLVGNAPGPALNDTIVEEEL